MKTPESLQTLVDDGIIQEVLRPLMSGKEAQVFVVRAAGQECVAKVYKEAHQRTFKHRTEYTEGRRTRNSRDQRAIAKRTRHGRKQDEAAWRSAEVDTIARLSAAGVRVPEPINFVDGVLVMELVQDSDGQPAPRLGDVELAEDEAVAIYQKLLREVIRMLCAGVIHGDLSEFNVLLGADGPVVIDFPQSVDASKNQSARKLLIRDVENLHRFLTRHAPRQGKNRYAEEMWALYEKNRLKPDTELRGDYRSPTGKTDMKEVLALIEDANQDEQQRREARGIDEPVVSDAPRRRVVDFTQEAPKRHRPSKPRDGAAPKNRSRKTSGRRGRPAGPKAQETRSADTSGAKPAAPAEDRPGPTRRRTRRRRPAPSGTQTQDEKKATSKEPPKDGPSAPRRRRRRRPRRPTPRSE